VTLKLSLSLPFPLTCLLLNTRNECGNKKKICYKIEFEDFPAKRRRQRKKKLFRILQINRKHVRQQQQQQQLALRERAE